MGEQSSYEFADSHFKPVFRFFKLCDIIFTLYIELSDCHHHWFTTLIWQIKHLKETAGSDRLGS